MTQKLALEEKIRQVGEIEKEVLHRRQVDTFGYDNGSGRFKRWLMRWIVHGVNAEAYSSYNPVLMEILLSKTRLQKEYERLTGERYVIR